MSNAPRDYSQKIQRTTADLIDELDAESKKFFITALAVGFEDNTVFVFSQESERLEKLNNAVRAGGEPIGLLGIVKEDAGEHSSLTFYCRALDEHRGEQWAEAYLESLMGSIGNMFGLQGVEKHDGWVN